MLEFIHDFFSGNAGASVRLSGLLSGRCGRFCLETLNHFLVPRVEVVQEKELAELLEKHDITLENLPRIKCDDAAVVALNAQPGAILKFGRKSLITDEEERYYRVVVD